MKGNHTSMKQTGSRLLRFERIGCLHVSEKTVRYEKFDNLLVVIFLCFLVVIVVGIELYYVVYFCGVSYVNTTLFFILYSYTPFTLTKEDILNAVTLLQLLYY